MNSQIYKLKEGVLEQQPEMKEPDGYDTFNFEKVDKYRDHIASLKTYPISGIIPESWKTGRDIMPSEFNLQHQFCELESSGFNSTWFNCYKEKYDTVPEKRRRIVAIPVKEVEVTNWRQELFNYMSGEHNCTLLESDMNEIENIVNPKKYPYPMFDEQPKEVEVNESDIWDEVIGICFKAQVYKSLGRVEEFRSEMDKLKSFTIQRKKL